MKKNSKAYKLIYIINNYFYNKKFTLNQVIEKVNEYYNINYSFFSAKQYFIRFKLWGFLKEVKEYDQIKYIINIFIPYSISTYILKEYCNKSDEIKNNILNKYLSEIRMLKIKNIKKQINE